MQKQMLTKLMFLNPQHQYLSIYYESVADNLFYIGFNPICKTLLDDLLIWSVKEYFSSFEKLILNSNIFKAKENPF